MPTDTGARLPLSPATLHILLALAGGSLHGYGIMQAVARDTEGRYKIGPGTLYDSLERLAEQGLVAEWDAGEASGGRRRRHYRLTALGRRVLHAELDRLEAVIARARAGLRPARSRG
jgi:DNA-binding PadR family transcriptional regulator